MQDITRNQDFAKAFVDHPDYITSLGLIKDTDALCIYNPKRGLFEIQDPDEMCQKMYKFMASCAKKSFTMSVVSDICEQVKQLVERRFQTADTKFLALKDCLLNMDDFTATPFDIEHNVFFGLPFNSTELNDAMFKDSRFAHFLDEVLITDQGLPDPELINLVQEMFGYCLLTSNICEASFFLVGEGSNGKSVLLHLLEQIVGEKWCSNLSIEQMTKTAHDTTALVGKRLNICTEEESSFVKSDKFKSLVSGEPTTINYKFGKIVRARLPIKYIYATNELPTFSGFNHGLLRRIKIIPFKRTFTDAQQDRQLISKLLKELPTITAWAMRGAQRLVKNKYKLSTATASEELKLDFESNLSAAVMFIREEYAEKESEFMFYSDLYTRFTEWCKETGRKQMSRPTFIRDISRALKLPSDVRYNSNTEKNERGRPLVRIGHISQIVQPEQVSFIPSL